ncbi:MAG: hypothetical protein HYT83_00225 [Candidatus Levybacteria bacterium]|nr:hypothetical protein [Candidatus Levybacteria bacterium]
MPTANWKTYKSTIVDTLGYELNLPSTWTITPFQGGEINAVPLKLAQVIHADTCTSFPENRIYIFHLISNNPTVNINKEIANAKADVLGKSIEETIQTATNISIQKVSISDKSTMYQYAFIISPKG